MKKKFYKLRQPSDPKIIGVKNGICQAEFLREYFINKNHYDEIIQYISLKNITSQERFPPFEIKLECVKMLPNAKLTDFISFRPHIPFAEYLISEKVAKILSTFNLSEHKLYPAIIDFNGKLINNYYLLFHPPFDFDVINYSKSLFYSGNTLLGKKFYSFNSYEEFYSFAKDKVIRAEKICLNDSKLSQLDYFDIRHASESFVSEDFKKSFEIAGITGIKFVEAQEPELLFDAQR